MPSSAKKHTLSQRLANTAAEIMVEAVQFGLDEAGSRFFSSSTSTGPFAELLPNNVLKKEILSQMVNFLPQMIVRKKVQRAVEKEQVAPQMKRQRRKTLRMI